MTLRSDQGRLGGALIREWARAAQAELMERARELGIAILRRELAALVITCPSCGGKGTVPASAAHKDYQQTCSGCAGKGQAVDIQALKNLGASQ